MTLSVQNDSGDVSDAVSYITVQEFVAYHSARGNSLGSSTEAQQESALVRATDYVDGRFRYIGEPLNGPTQVTAWPRSSAENPDGRMVYGVPKAVKDATAEYALRTLTGAPLVADPTRDASGYRVQSINQKVGELSQATTFASGSDGSFSMPIYPTADNKLLRAGLVKTRSSGTLKRA